MKTHTTIGASILSGSKSALVQMAEQIALSHHERWDGSGYPEGLKGDEIPLAARICAVCDVFDALLSPRPYKDAWPLRDVMRELGEPARHPPRPGAGGRLPAARGGPVRRVLRAGRAARAGGRRRLGGLVPDPAPGLRVADRLVRDHR